MRSYVLNRKCNTFTGPYRQCAVAASEDSARTAINGVYLDYHVDKIWLKALWRQKWSKRYNVNTPPPDWQIEAPWMAHFKDD